MEYLLSDRFGPIGEILSKVATYVFINYQVNSRITNNEQ
jgi:hypothetical protein